MFIIRLIFIIAAIWLARKAWLVTKKALENNSQNSAPNEKPAEMMVTCNHCGTHLPESSAVQSENLWFCNPEHLEAYQREHQ